MRKFFFPDKTLESLHLSGQCNSHKCEILVTKPIYPWPSSSNTFSPVFVSPSSKSHSFLANGRKQRLERKNIVHTLQDAFFLSLNGMLN